MRGPWETLTAMGDIVLGWRRLPSGRGWWVPEERVILLDSRLSKVEARCTLAHELIHVQRSHEACFDDRSDRRQEREADEAAARWLIPLELLVDAALFGRHPMELAEDLGVDVGTLDVRLRTLTVGERAVLNGRVESRDEGVA